MAPGMRVNNLKVLERCSIAVAESTAPPPPLPLTHFDVFWFPLQPFERVFLYTLPVSTAVFLETTVPNLKRSLSLALQRFYPLAGKLIASDGCSSLPYIRFSNGDAVELTVAESDADLNSLTTDAPKASSRFRGLTPTLPFDLKAESGSPVLAVQLTLFPEQGIAVGLTFPHTIMDGFSAAHFMRTWAAFNQGSPLEEEPPFFDRTSVLATEYAGAAAVAKFTANLPQADPPRHEEVKHGVVEEEVVDPVNCLVRATFRITNLQIEALRRRVGTSSCAASGQPRFSSYALVTALAWSTILKARGCCSNGEDDKERFLIACNLRSRLSGVPIPRAYFGNVVGQCVVAVDRTELLGPDGIALAAAAVREAILGLSEGRNGAWEAVKVLKAELYSKVGLWRPLMIAGSPQLGVYGVDFGWGRPLKTEVLATDCNGSVVLAEGREEDGGGLEIGVVMPAAQMQVFSKLFEVETAGLDRLV